MNMWVWEYGSMQVYEYASMQVYEYASMQVYTCLYKKLNKKKEKHRWPLEKIWNANKCGAIYMSAVAAFLNLPFAFCSFQIYQ